MENKNKAKIMGYVVTTFLIAFISQLDQIDFAFSSLNASKWAGVLLKSAMPCLISLKALLDGQEKEDRQNGGLQVAVKPMAVSPINLTQGLTIYGMKT